MSPSLVNECIPFKEPGARVTGTPSVAVIGKRFVAISGAKNADGTYTIAPPAAGGRVLGVASYDCPIGGKVTIIRQRNNVVPVTAGAANIAAFAEVEVDAQGRVVPLAAGRAVGFLMTTGPAAIGGDAEVSLY